MYYIYAMYECAIYFGASFIYCTYEGDTVVLIFKKKIQLQFKNQLAPDCQTFLLYDEISSECL